MEIISDNDDNPEILRRLSKFTAGKWPGLVNAILMRLEADTLELLDKLENAYFSYGEADSVLDTVFTNDKLLASSSKLHQLEWELMQKYADKIRLLLVA